MTAPDADRWQRIQALFEAALEVPAGEQRAFVAARCEGDAELALEVLGLLAADAENPDYLDGMAAGLADLVSASRAESADPLADRADALVGAGDGAQGAALAVLRLAGEDQRCR